MPLYVHLSIQAYSTKATCKRLCFPNIGKVPPLEISRVKRSHECVAMLGKGRDDHGPGPIAVVLEAAKVAVYKEKRPTICFVCLGDESLPMERRLYSFSSPTDLSKHLKRGHLAYIGEADSFTCDLCRVCLDGRCTYNGMRSRYTARSHSCLQWLGSLLVYKMSA
ncbi:hypothetical protein B0J11DRAFT_193650 [Dendryphion nanum]|uniref:Uncharacterized protein n=1 Tax=Dendryphion nanum TaxID=256645 RepID=A0A9P9D272_9PLEO|nr:hypothetical protein B0J11DRAFT_193650 [Dendryphion nanum]